MQQYVSWFAGLVPEGALQTAAHVNSLIRGAEALGNREMKAAVRFTPGYKYVSVPGALGWAEGAIGSSIGGAGGHLSADQPKRLRVGVLGYRGCVQLQFEIFNLFSLAQKLCLRKTNIGQEVVWWGGALGPLNPTAKNLF